jgi:hypothetical protein
MRFFLPGIKLHDPLSNDRDAPHLQTQALYSLRTLSGRVFFAELTRDVLADYAKLHGYDFFYDADTPVPQQVHELHFRRCVILRRAQQAFPAADWYIWLDTDIYVQQRSLRIEEVIDLDDPSILYHLFHEKPWQYPVNTGVKLVHRSAIHWEDEIYARRHGCTFPYEQRVVCEYILPTYGQQVRIHDPDRMNCLYGIHRHQEALFVHVCFKPEMARNLIILRNTRELLDPRSDLARSKHYHYYYYYYYYHLARSYAQRVPQAIKRRLSRGTFKDQLEELVDIRSSRKTCAGDFQPRILRGRSLSISW